MGRGLAAGLDNEAFAVIIIKGGRAAAELSHSSGGGQRRVKWRHRHGAKFPTNPLIKKREKKREKKKEKTSRPHPIDRIARPFLHDAPLSPPVNPPIHATVGRIRSRVIGSAGVAVPLLATRKNNSRCCRDWNWNSFL